MKVIKKNYNENLIYKSMKTEYNFTKNNYFHICNFNHFQNELVDQTECKWNEECKSFKRLENGRNKIEDLCHSKIYRHPPRKRNILLSENVKNMVLNKKKNDNIPVYEPTDNDSNKYLLNEKDGYLNALTSEIIRNGFKYDLCFKCEINEKC
eukprot:491200_1